ncbi:MAG: methylhydantoinase, partial [Rhodospirillaceae bacterium]|nr:methylhydantoinase [Rhodospirillaceae bacterium]
KDQDIALAVGECVNISTPGGGGYGDARKRDPALVLEDVKRGYYSREEAERLFAVVLTGEPFEIDADATEKIRAGR